MNNDITFCNCKTCPIKESCRRYRVPKMDLWVSFFVEDPCEWYDDGNYFYCQEYWSNKPLKKYTMEQVKQELNVKK